MRILKSHLLAFIALWLAMGCLTSCENKVADVERDDVKVNIILNNVVSQFTARTLSEKDMYSDDGMTSKIIVKVLIYDDNGKLFKQFTRTIADYNEETISIDAPTPGVNPLLVCFTYATFTDKDGETFDSYKISGEQSLSTLKVTNESNTTLSIPWKVLGGAIVSIGAKSGEVNVPVRPLGALAYCEYRNIHAHDSDKKAPTMLRFWSRFNDCVTVKNRQFSFSCTLGEFYYFTNQIYPKDFVGDRVYFNWFLMPGEAKVEGTSYTSPSNYTVEGDEEEVKRSDNKSINVVEGKQYVFTIDYDNYTVDLKEGTY